jgi:hypothetical protein
MIGAGLRLFVACFCMFIPKIKLLEKTIALPTTNKKEETKNEGKKDENDTKKSDTQEMKERSTHKPMSN